MEPFFTERQDGTVTVITFTTESLMNSGELERIGDGLGRAVEAGGPGLLLDCTRVRYLSSQAIGMLLGLRKKVTQKGGGKLVLRGVGPQLMELLRIASLHRVFTIE